MPNILKENVDFTWGVAEGKGPFGLNYSCPVTNDGVKLLNISEPYKNSVMYIYNKESKELIPVLILDGAWLSNGRLSNWWRWQELDDNLNLKDIKSGYGCFYKPEKKFNVEISYKISVE